MAFSEVAVASYWIYPSERSRSSSSFPSAPAVAESGLRRARVAAARHAARSFASRLTTSGWLAATSVTRP
jgi:hypothetical protein